MAFMILCFVICSIWDGITTALGVAVIIGANDPLGYAMCAAAGLIVLGFCIGTRTVWSRSGPVFMAMRILWVGAVGFDFYTSFIGNTKYIILRNTLQVGKSLVEQLTAEQFFVVLFLTALVSGSPIFLGYLTNDKSDDAA